MYNAHINVFTNLELEKKVSWTMVDGLKNYIYIYHNWSRTKNTWGKNPTETFVGHTKLTQSLCEALELNGSDYRSILQKHKPESTWTKSKPKHVSLSISFRKHTRCLQTLIFFMKTKRKKLRYVTLFISCSTLLFERPWHI